MRKPTGQMQELTQKKLDEYNELYNWSYNDMCDFIESYGEEAFVEHYDTETIEHFEDMYQGQYDSGAEFAEQIASDCGYVSRDMPSWIEIDWQKTWDNALSYDYTQIGYAIFNDNY